MTLPTNLFIDTPEMNDVSLHQLNSDTEAWPEEVIQKMKERIPQTGGMNMMVKFMKKDDENGAATGSVIISNAEKAAVVPVIIKDFMLSPLDIMIADSKLLPLTPDYFAAIFSKTDVFASIEEFPTFAGIGRFEGENLWNTIYPPSLGRYAYASAGYPLLDAISDDLDGSSLKNFLKDPANEKVAARLLSGPHQDLIIKVANLQPVNMNEFRQGVENLIPRSIVMLRREQPNKYSILSNADTVFHPGIMYYDQQEALAVCSKLSDHAEDDINDVDQNGEKFLRIPEARSNVFLDLPATEIPEPALEYDHYVVKTKSGVSIEGVVIPRVIDFDQKSVNLKVFLGKTMSTIQEQIAGVRVKNSSFHPKFGVPQVGQTGVFVYQPDKAHALCTIPVTIKAISSDKTGDSIDNKIVIKAVDLLGRTYALEIGRVGGYLQRIVRAEPGHYQLPTSMKWAAMEGFSEVTNSPEDYAVKIAAEVKTVNPITLIPTGYGQYSMKGVAKYAHELGWDSTNLAGYQAKFLMASLGMGSEIISESIKVASIKGKTEIHNWTAVPTMAEKIARAVPLADHMRKVAGSIKTNLIKEASYIENAQTLDSLLSLNFVSPDNIAKFVAKTPQFNSAISNLASRILGSRIGMKEIPEHAAMTAMSRLIEVVTGLEKLRATQELGVQ